MYSLAQCLTSLAAFVGLMVASPSARAADGPLAEQDREELRAFCVEDVAEGPNRITRRFDERIDQALGAMVAGQEKPAKGSEKGRKSGKRQRGSAADKDALTALDFEALGSSAMAWRLVRLLEAMPRGNRSATWQRLESAMPFAQALAFTYHPTEDKLTELAMLACRLITEDGATVDRYPALAAALCVVFDDGPPSVSINRNRASAPSAELAWRHFTTHAGSMRYGLDIAPELLVHVVDACASSEELAWALDRFAKTPRAGSLYTSVEYDYGVLEGRPMKSQVAGWNLPNILAHGGVCADQAHFAATVAKAIGIPASYTVGQDTSSTHAWVGFAHTVGTVTAWDVEGRYDSYRGVEGRVVDPQTRQSMPDAVLPMLVQWGLEPGRDRLRASVLRTVDERLSERLTGPQRRADESRQEFERRAAAAEPKATQDREAIAAMRLTVLRTALQAAPTDVRTWRRVQRLGTERAVDEGEMRRWLDAIVELCGRSYPEMVVEIAQPLIQSVPPGDEQHALWARLAEVVSSRQDLGARVLYLDGRMWEGLGETRRAGRAYEEALTSFPNGGASMQAALGRAAQILRSGGDARRLVALYDMAFGRMTPPKDFPGIFGRSSAWYQVGNDYANVLREVGRSRDADTLKATLDRYVTAKGT